MPFRAVLSLLFAVFTVGAAAGGDESTYPAACSDAWYLFIDERVTTGDGRGHGPDRGSDEWKSVVEFRLGIRGEPGVPARDSEAWCRYIDQVVRGDEAPDSAIAPSFSCEGVEDGSIEALVCSDESLAALDRKLASVYAAASKKAVNEHPPMLKAEQRGWIKGRDECWKADDSRECVTREYVRRIAGLQARYRLVPAGAPVSYGCEGNPANEVVVTFFSTEPPTLIAERGDSVSLMYLQPGGENRYLGRNESFQARGGEAVVTWGYGAPAMHCEKLP